MTVNDKSNLSFGGTRDEPTACRESLRVATHAPHERLHRHSGFAAVKDGTIGPADYRTLLVCLFGFYVPFERAIDADRIRTQWLARDLNCLGVDAESIGRIRLCADIPRYDFLERRIGALYVVEGSALGGRQLYRGLDQLLGKETTDGRRFFAGRGAETGSAWSGFLDQLALVGAEPTERAAMVGAAVETFEIFETWLHGWKEMR